MNAHVEVPYALENFRRYFGFSQRMRRNAHEWKRRALAEAASGHMDRYWRYRAFSDNNWNDAKDALFRAKMIKERMQ